MRAPHAPARRDPVYFVPQILRVVTNAEIRSFETDERLTEASLMSIEAQRGQGYTVNSVCLNGARDSRANSVGFCACLRRGYGSMMRLRIA